MNDRNHSDDSHLHNRMPMRPADELDNGEMGNPLPDPNDDDGDEIGVEELY